MKCPDIEKLIAYCDGELPPEEANPTAGHIQTCETCRLCVESLNTSLLAAKSIWAELDPDTDELAALPSRKNYRIFTISRFVATAAVLLLVFGLFSLYWFGSQNQPPQKNPA